MSRTEVAGAPKVPNLQSMVIGPIKPPGLGAEGKMECGGPPANMAPEVRKEERLAPSYMVGTSITGHNSELDAKPRRYRVSKAGTYKMRNSPAQYAFCEGKILDDINYDIKAVRAQGIRLVEVGEDDEPLPEKK